MGQEANGPVVKPLISTFRIFSQETSLHGIKKAADAEYSAPRRIVWWVILLVMTGLFLRAFISGLQQYFSYPLSMNIRMEPGTDLPFPDVTVCNNNHLRKSFIDAYPMARKWYDVHQPVYGRRGVPADQAEDVQRWLNTTDAATHYRQGAHLQEHFLYDCEFGRQSLNCGDIVSPSFTLEGLCYTLSPKRISTSVGYTSGLSFKVNIEHREYDVHSGSAGFGVKLIIHETGVHPGFFLISLEPGKEMFIALRPSKYIWMDSPYSKEGCIGNPEPGYSKEGCLMLCAFQYYQDRLGCDFTGTHENLPNCSLYQREASSTAAYRVGVSQGLRANGSSCGCRMPCEHYTYPTHLSSMGYPSDFAVSHLNRSLNQSFLAKNIIFVNVFFESLNVRVTEQHAAYTFQSLTSDVGGLMGLCVGASIITVSEGLEFLLLLMSQALKSVNNIANRNIEQT